MANTILTKTARMAAVVCAALCILAPAAYAEGSATMIVSMQVETSCSVVGGQTVTVSCNAPAAYEVRDAADDADQQGQRERVQTEDGEIEVIWF